MDLSGAWDSLYFMRLWYLELFLEDQLSTLLEEILVRLNLNISIPMLRLGE